MPSSVTTDVIHEHTQHSSVDVQHMRKTNVILSMHTFERLRDTLSNSNTQKKYFGFWNQRTYSSKVPLKKHFQIPLRYVHIYAVRE